jgi:hypothetical protein
VQSEAAGLVCVDSSVLCFDMALSAQFIGDISLIPSGLRNWVALYVDPRSNKPWISSVRRPLLQ